MKKYGSLVAAALILAGGGYWITRTRPAGSSDDAGFRTYTARRADNLAQILAASAAVVRVHVDKLGAPYWNTNDQTRHKMPHMLEQRYTDATVTVLETLYGKAPANTFTLTLRGDGVRWEGYEQPPWERRSGGLVEDAEQVIAIGEEPFGFEDGPDTRWTLTAGYQANWRIDAGQLLNSDVSRWNKLSPDAFKALVGLAAQGNA